jgi:hypothetical protein
MQPKRSAGLPRPEAYTAPVSPLIPIDSPPRLAPYPDEGLGWTSLLYLPAAVFAVFGGVISYALLRQLGVDVDGGAGWWQPVPFAMWFGGTLGLAVVTTRLERLLRRLTRV